MEGNFYADFCLTDAFLHFLPKVANYETNRISSFSTDFRAGAEEGEEALSLSTALYTPLHYFD